jgi:hypothetical protein
MRTAKERSLSVRNRAAHEDRVSAGGTIEGFRGGSPLDTAFRIAKVAALDKNTVQACSSVGEHYLDTVGVGGSIPPMPTNFSPASGHEGESRALTGLGCYPAQPLDELALSILRFASAAARGMRSECPIRE